MFFGAGKASAASFTSTTSGNWDDGATWGHTSPGVEGTDYPSTAGGDTVTISGQHTVTIPVGHNARATVSALNSGVSGTHTKLVINGSLRLQGAMTLNNYVELNLGAGSTLDLDNQTISQANAAYVWYSWQGTSGSRATIKSTTPGGKFAMVNVGYTDINWNYVDFSDLGDSKFGERTTSAMNCVINHITTTSCGDFQFYSLMDDASNFSISNSDFRTPTGTNKYLIYASLSGTNPTGTRTMSNNTFYSTVANSQARISSKSFTTDNCIFENVYYTELNGSHTIQNSFFHDNVSSNYPILSTIGSTGLTITESYAYVDGDNSHSISAPAQDTSIDHNIFECPSHTTDTSDFIFPANASGKTLTVNNNIFLSDGSPITNTTNNALQNIALYNNTSYISSGATSARLFYAENVTYGTGATVSIRSNLVVDKDTTNNDTGVKLYNTTADQIDYTDYNAWYGYPGGDVNDHYYNVAITGKTEGQTGFGGNDKTVDPQFVDKTRTFAKWDTSLGGPGTATNAIAEMLKMNGYGGTFNSNYTPANLVTYIRAGFAPTNVALKGAGDPADGSPDIGAVAVQDVTAPTVTAFTIPSTSTALTVSVSSFTATDNLLVTGYKLTESATTPGAGDAGWSGTAPASYTFSTQGSKTLYAWAKDAAGNVSTSLNASVTVDTTAPGTTASPAGGLYNTSKDVTLTCADGSGSGCDQIYYTTNGTDPNTGSTHGSSPVNLTISSTTALKFFAKDLAGNSESINTETYTIDTTPPVTSLDSHPGSSTNSTSATFTFSANETSTFQCKLDSGAYASCSSPKSYTSLSEGSHTFYVKAIDTATNEDPTPESFTWTIDTTAPTISNASPNNQTLSNTTTSTNLTLNTTETAACKYSTSSGTDYALMTEFDDTDDTTHSTFVSGLNPGSTYNYYIKCRDGAANESTETHITFSVAAITSSDVSLNTIKIKVARAINKFKDTLHIAMSKFKLKGEDSHLANGTVKIYKGHSLIDTIAADAEGFWQKTLRFKNGTSKEVKVKMYDANGNLLDTQKAKIKVDTKKPVISDFPFYGQRFRAGSTVQWKAEDNQKIDHYRIYFNGNITTRKTPGFLIPKDTRPGDYGFNLVIYDEAGNRSSKSTAFIVR